MDRATKFGQIYFSILGIAAIVFGILGFTVLGRYGLAGQSWGPLAMSAGDFGEGLWWMGIILIGAGALYLSSVPRFGETRQLAKAVGASIMIWIVAAMSIFGMVAGSIPVGSEAESGPWFQNVTGFFTAYAWPYDPSIFLLPFSLVIIYFILRKRAEEKAEMHPSLRKGGSSDES